MSADADTVLVRRPSSPLYALWDAELQEAFNRLAEREGVRRAAQMLDVAERNLYDYRAGLARAGNRKGTVLVARLPKRKRYLSLAERPAVARERGKKKRA